MDKLKDKLSSKRSDQPDDPISGTNFDQKNRENFTDTTTGTSTAPHHSGSTHHQQQQPGVGGITSGVDNAHIVGSGTGSHSHGGSAGGLQEGRGGGGAF